MSALTLLLTLAAQCNATPTHPLGSVVVGATSQTMALSLEGAACTSATVTLRPPFGGSLRANVDAATMTMKVELSGAAETGSFDLTIGSVKWAARVVAGPELKSVRSLSPYGGLPVEPDGVDDARGARDAVSDVWTKPGTDLDRGITNVAEIDLGPGLGASSLQLNVETHGRGFHFEAVPSPSRRRQVKFWLPSSAVGAVATLRFSSLTGAETVVFEGFALAEKVHPGSVVLDLTSSLRVICPRTTDIKNIQGLCDPSLAWSKPEVVLMHDTQRAIDQGALEKGDCAAFVCPVVVSVTKDGLARARALLGRQKVDVTFKRGATTSEALRLGLDVWIDNPESAKGWDAAARAVTAASSEWGMSLQATTPTEKLVVTRLKAVAPEAFEAAKAADLGDGGAAAAVLADYRNRAFRPVPFSNTSAVRNADEIIVVEMRNAATHYRARLRDKGPFGAPCPARVFASASITPVSLRLPGTPADLTRSVEPSVVAVVTGPPIYPWRRQGLRLSKSFRGGLTRTPGAR